MKNDDLSEFEKVILLFVFASIWIIYQIKEAFNMEKEFDTDFYLFCVVWTVAVVLATMFFIALRLGYCY
jgi:hypothetical protein